MGANPRSAKRKTCVCIKTISHHKVVSTAPALYLADVWVCDQVRRGLIGPRLREEQMGGLLLRRRHDEIGGDRRAGVVTVVAGGARSSAPDEFG